jgi:hypothetical protein
MIIIGNSANWRIPSHKKKIIALRLYYLGGYTVYFYAQVRRMLAYGYAEDELLSACVDNDMRRWVHKALSQR